MISITDPGIPNGLTGNLAALMQTLIDKPRQERELAVREKTAKSTNDYQNASLAENIRNHDMLDKYHAGEVDNGATRADTGAKRAGTYQQSVDQTGATSAARVDETVRHDQATEGQAANAEGGRDARADEANVRAMHNAWMNTPVGMMATAPEQEEHYNGLMEAVQKRRASKVAIPGKPAPTAQPAVDTTAPAAQPASAAPQVGQPPAVGQAPAPASPPASTAQIQLLHKAAQWKVLPSLTDSDKQKVQQAIDSKNFKALQAMEAKLGQSTPGAYAR